MLLFLDKIVKGVTKALEEAQRQQAEQIARQKAMREAAKSKTRPVNPTPTRPVNPTRTRPVNPTPTRLVTTDTEHTVIKHFGDENVFDEYVKQHHDPTDEIVDVVDLSEFKGKSSFESDRTHQLPIAPDAFKILRQPHGPRNAFILSEIFNRPEHRW